MDGLFSALLCCCSRSKTIEEEDEEQNRQLIQAAEDPQISNYGSVTIDDHTAKERLNVIVRAKQGKMVNVLARVPFNLRDDANSKQGNTSSPSRSTRSFSANLNRPTIMHDGSSRASSPKPSPSISRSESVSSLHHASTSHTLLEDDLEPVLNARLISTNKSKQRILGRRGRSTTRQGRFGIGDVDAGDNATPVLEGIQSVGSVTGETSEPDEAVRNDAQEARITEGPNVKPLGQEDEAIIRTLSNNISSTLKDGFKIQDVGTLALSWGE